MRLPPLRRMITHIPSGLQVYYFGAFQWKWSDYGDLKVVFAAEPDANYRHMQVGDRSEFAGVEHLIRYGAH